MLSPYVISIEIQIASKSFNDFIHSTLLMVRVLAIRSFCLFWVASSSSCYNHWSTFQSHCFAFSQWVHYVSVRQIILVDKIVSNYFEYNSNFFKHVLMRQAQFTSGSLIQILKSLLLHIIHFKSQLQTPQTLKFQFNDKSFYSNSFTFWLFASVCFIFMCV